MQTVRRYTPFFASATLMCVVLCIIYPHYQYYVDPDSTAYLTIARRYATGDYQRAINGYWSPWACWLTAGLMSTGLGAILSGVIVNAAGAVGLLFISQSFFLKFGITDKLQWLFNVTLALFLCYAVFDQSFDDLWECFFLLGSLRLMICEEFKRRPGLWVLYGLMGTLAYFAKAYSFPFFLLNTVCCVYFVVGGNVAQWLKISAVAIAVMLFGSHFWIVALHHKYGIWTTSTAGSLNMSWYLVGHPQWKEEIKLLLPPAYDNSPYYWEDPYFANGATPHFWSSWHLFGLQFLRGGLNVFKLFMSMIKLSVFFPFISIVLARFVMRQRSKSTAPAFTVALSFLLFPLGYLLINFESRYIWYILPLGMLATGLFIQNHLSQGKKTLAIVFPYLFAISFLICPAWRMGTMYNEGMHEYTIAQQLRTMNIHGSFTSLAKPGIEVQQIERLAYFSENQLYSNPQPANCSMKDVLSEMRRYHVRYFFAWGASEAPFTDERGDVFPEITKGSIPGLRVFQVN